MNPLPQRAFVDTWRDSDGTAADDVDVFASGGTTAADDVDVFAIERDGVKDEELCKLEHVPNFELHVVPQ